MHNVFRSLSARAMLSPGCVRGTNRSSYKKRKTMPQGRNISACSVIAIFVLAFVFVATSLPASAQSEAAGAPTVNHNTWTSGAPMPTPVYYPATGVLKGQIYIVGGGVTYTTYTSDVQIYNPVTNTWSTSVPFPTVSIAATGAVVKNILY